MKNRRKKWFDIHRIVVAGVVIFYLFTWLVYWRTLPWYFSLKLFNNETYNYWFNITFILVGVVHIYVIVSLATYYYYKTILSKIINRFNLECQSIIEGTSTLSFQFRKHDAFKFFSDSFTSLMQLCRSQESRLKSQLALIHDKIQPALTESEAISAQEILEILEVESEHLKPTHQQESAS